MAAELVSLAEVGRDDLVLEIGSGEGIITAELARAAGYVVAMEVDRRLVQRLRQRFGPDSAVLVVEGDALRQALPGLSYRVVSNVPFDATTRLLRRLLDPASRLERAALIVQWEVARKRVRERPSTLLGVSWAPWWDMRLVRRLPSAAFRPSPPVDAGVLLVKRRHEPLLSVADAGGFRLLLAEGFAHGPRRLLSGRESRRLGLSPRAGARDLAPEDWVTIFRFLRSRGRA